ncbi:class I adenylate-forming enzyme family protein [Streptantibioticus ferralitis]|uniref:AMP-binding protein n=1 Tax=Streptantibioticus ferralitis TaxID=236510 RepID=A0ABT5Z9Y2_9ACTN|nr:AMP-binding protein [Streptantibioticus ferralitis]MDF2260647.1 AMP-binding protein [Streptantibioticus ferralitis]
MSATTPHDLGASRTLWELIARRAALTPDAPVLLDESDRRVTFGAFATRAERTAAGLYGLGVRPGSRVCWQLPTRIETVVLCAALARIGAVQSPVIPIYRDREVGHAVQRADARFLITPGPWRGFDHTAMARRLARRLPEPPQLLSVYDRLPDGDPATLPPPPADGREVRWIYWTSGTTSAPKGVLHSDRSLIAGGSCLAHALRMRSDDVGSIAFPYAHIGGLDYLVMLLLYGFPALLLERFALPGALDAYRRHGVTLAGGSTAFYSLFLAQQRQLPPEERLVPTLRLLAGGGAPKPPELYHEVVRELGCQLTHGYGMTEAPMITMGSPLDTPEQLATTEGRPPAEMEIRIVDGEVRLRGEAVCQGYADPDQTVAAFDEQGFFRTGDLGRLTAAGHLVLTGRLKDIIIRKGENISAKEIEELLYQHPGIHDAAVIGLPDAERGERVCAVVEQPAGCSTLTLAEVTTFLRGAGLAVHKLPEQLEVVPALPRNEALRKVLKYELRERFAGS